MNSMAMTSRFISIAALGLVGAVGAMATPIFVSNFSFEALPGTGLNKSGCGPGCAYSTGAIPGWTGVSTGSGEFHPGLPAQFTTLSAGPTVGYSNGITLSQTVGVTVTPGTTYTLQVDLGERNDLGPLGFRGGADLLIGGVSVFPAIGLAPTPGNWSTFTATYVGLPADATKTITIQLTSSGAQGDFDNVRLTSVAAAAGVPEPGTVTLIGLGLAGLLVVVSA